MKTMKQITIAISLLLAFGQLNAQKLSYGIQAGANFAVQSSIGDLYNNDDIRVGYQAGGFGNYSLTDNFSLQTEVNYTQIGSQNDEVKNCYDYFSVPLLANYSLTQSKNEAWTLSLYAGPYVSFLVNAESVFENSEYSDIDLTDNTESTEFGVLYGFSVKRPIYNHNVSLNVRFGMGLTAYDVDDSDPRNKFFGIGLAYEL
jgi:hypothetical protein